MALYNNESLIPPTEIFQFESGIVLEGSFTNGTKFSGPGVLKFECVSNPDLGFNLVMLWAGFVACVLFWTPFAVWWGYSLGRDGHVFDSAFAPAVARQNLPFTEREQKGQRKISEPKAGCQDMSSSGVRGSVPLGSEVKLPSTLLTQSPWFLAFVRGVKRLPSLYDPKP